MYGSPDDKFGAIGSPEEASGGLRRLAKKVVSWAIFFSLRALFILQMSTSILTFGPEALVLAQ